MPYTLRVIVDPLDWNHAADLAGVGDTDGFGHIQRYAGLGGFYGGRGEGVADYERKAKRG